MKHAFIALTIIALHLVALQTFAQNTSVRIALLKYNGGGDWYANPTSLPNLVEYCNRNINTLIFAEPSTAEVGSKEIFSYPFLHMTGHGNVIFSDQEAKNLRQYLMNGGFLHIDDNFGLDPFVRREMKKVFPDFEWVELPPSHAIFKKPYQFAEGLPKIHEHDNKPPQAFAIFINDRMVCLYTYESDLGDGWEDPEVHHDSADTHLKALKMGANIMHFVFTQ